MRGKASTCCVSILEVHGEGEHQMLHASEKQCYVACCCCLPEHDVEEVPPVDRFQVHYSPIPGLDVWQGQTHEHQKWQDDEASHGNSSPPDNVQASVVHV